LVLAQQKKFDEASGAYQGRADRSANAGKFYSTLAPVCEYRNLDPAAVAFRKAIDLDPNYAEAYYHTPFAMGKATIQDARP